MAGTPNSTHDEPRFDGSFAVPEDFLADVEEALARLVRETYAPKADAPKVDALTPDLRDTDPAPARRSRGKRGTLAHVAIMVCLGAVAIGAWRATVPAPIETAAHAAPIARPAMTAANGASAAAAERQQIRTAHDLADLRRMVDQLAAGQRQLIHRMSRLKTEKPHADAPPAETPDKRMPRRASPPPAPRVAMHKPAAMTPMPRPAPRRVSMVSRPAPPSRPAPQIQSEARLSEAAPVRPPMPVPEP